MSWEYHNQDEVTPEGFKQDAANLDDGKGDEDKRCWCGRQDPFTLSWRLLGNSMRSIDLRPLLPTISLTLPDGQDEISTRHY